MRDYYREKGKYTSHKQLDWPRYWAETNYAEQWWSEQTSEAVMAQKCQETKFALLGAISRMRQGYVNYSTAGPPKASRIPVPETPPAVDVWIWN